MIELTHLRHVSLFSTNLTEQSGFYEKIWGVDRVSQTADSVHFRGASSEYFILGLHASNRCGLHHLAFGVKDEAAVRAAADALRAQGVRLVTEAGPLDEPGGGCGFRFVDPEGRLIELSADVARQEGGWQERPVRPHSICHVVLNTSRLDSIAEFYTQNFNFKVSDWSEHVMVFLRCNTKHHAIAFNQAPHASVNHVAYLVANVDEVMRGLGNMRQHGFEPGWGPGRHGPGNNIFCYFTEPFGYVVEYTSDIDFILDDAAHVPKVWKRIPGQIDRWGIAGPPSPAIRQAMEGEPDPGWAA